MENFKTFTAGTTARCNRCDAPSPLPKDVEGMRENRKAYRLRGFATLGCGHMDCHWVFISDNPELEDAWSILYFDDDLTTELNAFSKPSGH